MPTLLGIPLDVNSSYLRGPASAPAKIREAFAKHGVELATPSGEVAREKTNTLIEELQRGGHKLNHAVLTALMADRSAWAYVEMPESRRARGHADLAAGLPTPAYGPDAA